MPPTDSRHSANAGVGVQPHPPSGCGSHTATRKQEYTGSHSQVVATSWSAHTWPLQPLRRHGLPGIVVDVVGMTVVVGGVVVVTIVVVVLSSTGSGAGRLDVGNVVLVVDSAPPSHPAFERLRRQRSTRRSRSRR